MAANREAAEKGGIDNVGVPHEPWSLVQLKSYTSSTAGILMDSASLFEIYMQNICT